MLLDSISQEVSLIGEYEPPDLATVAEVARATPSYPLTHLPSHPVTQIWKQRTIVAFAIVSKQKEKRLAPIQSAHKIAPAKFQSQPAAGWVSAAEQQRSGG